MMLLGTKAEVLDRLSRLVKNGKILPQYRFTLKENQRDPKEVISQVKVRGWLDLPLIVRSSAQIEDSVNQSCAGHFASVLDVRGEEALLDAVERVISSFDGANEEDQVLIQPMLQKVAISGVAFSKNPTSGAPYILINYDDSSGSTTSVTAGTTNELKAYCHYRFSDFLPPAPLDRVVHLVHELEHLLQIDHLDIEFAIDVLGHLFLLQVRPLVLPKHLEGAFEEHTHALQTIAKKIEQSYGPHPYLHGSRTIYGVMPDWNPAEIIGIRPKPLALSLYKEIITDQIWAYQRDNYGYCNLRSFPLLVDFHGLPYIDVRVSFNSFIPRSLDTKIAEKLVNYYLRRLEEFPNCHDKVEFEIVYSCYTLDLPQRLEVLKNHGFTEEELGIISTHLRNLTNHIIDGEKGLWKSDIEKIPVLQRKYEAICNSGLDSVSKIYWLIEDCKRYGTLPFAGLARAGFIAVQLLKSLVHVNILSFEEYNQFLQSLDTVSSSLTEDLSNLSQVAFLKKYGHLRPGTYDLLSPSYEEEPDTYFDWENRKLHTLTKAPAFHLSLSQMKQIEQYLKVHGLNHNIISFFDFIKAAIEGREYSKFVFSRSLSQTLTLIKQLGKAHGLSLEECSYLDIAAIKKLYSSSADVGAILRKSSAEGYSSYAVTEQILLPPLINRPDQVFSFMLPVSEPNYITLKKAKGRRVLITEDKSELKGAILLIPSADPGYDWIFSHQITGFITMYGGMNSHMAIRAGELGIPAVIGAGEVLYRQWEKGKVLEIDCANRQVRILQ